MSRTNTGRRTARRFVEIQPGIETLEQRCLLTTIELGNLGTVGTTLFGADALDQSGSSLSNAGDVNGDGFDDFIIGAPNAAGTGDSSSIAGVSYVVFGGPSMPTTIDLANLGSAGITIVGVDLNDGSGSSVSSAGDVNGDGFGDLIIGAPFSDGLDNSRTQSGESYVVFGGAALASTINLAALGSAGITIFGADAYDGSGTSVSNVGDVNGDGYGDLIIGACYGAGAGNLNDNSGESYLVFGGSSLSATIDLANLGTAGVTIYGAEPDDLSGCSVSNAGDVNGDGLSDFMIGASASSGQDNGHTNAGESYLIFGSASFPTTIELSSLGSAGVTLYGADAGDESGVAVGSAGDINGDGFEDLVIGANKADGVGGAKNGAGETYLIFGGVSMPTTINLANLESAGVTIYGADASDFSGSSVAGVGDVNGDGFDDLLIGSGRGEREGDVRLTSGKSIVVFGGTSLPTMIDLASLGSQGNTIIGIDLGDLSGQTVSGAGDVNGDGIDDLLIGAIGGDGAGNAKLDAGESYLIFGSGNQLPVFTSSTTISINENQTAIMTVTAVDADLPAQTLTYSISSGADQDKFAITSGGVLKFNSVRDYEKPTDVGADNVYHVRVTVNDGAGGLSTQDIAVTVTDVNDAPVFQTASAINIYENLTTVETLVATDADLPAQTITYAITGGSDQSLFSITIDGLLTFNSAPDFSNPADVGANNIYDVQVTANDGNGGSVGQNIAVTVIDTNFNAPVFISSATFNVSENTTSVGTTVATDADEPAQAITYSISGGADQAKFTINNGGVLRFATPPNFENPTDSDEDNVYQLQVMASDGNGGLTVQDITVNVTDVNEVLSLTLGGPEVTWINRRSPVTILPFISVSGNANLTGGTLTISVNAIGTPIRLLDKFNFPSSNGLGSTNGRQVANGKLTLQIQLNQNVTMPEIQAFLRAMTFSTKTKGFKTLTRTMDVTLATADGLSSTVRQTIHVRKRA